MEGPVNIYRTSSAWKLSDRLSTYLRQKYEKRAVLFYVCNLMRSGLRGIMRQFCVRDEGFAIVGVVSEIQSSLGGDKEEVSIPVAACVKYTAETEKRELITEDELGCVWSSVLTAKLNQEGSWNSTASVIKWPKSLKEPPANLFPVAWARVHIHRTATYEVANNSESAPLVFVQCSNTTIALLVRPLPKKVVLAQDFAEDWYLIDHSDWDQPANIVQSGAAASNVATSLSGGPGPETCTARAREGHRVQVLSKYI